MFDTAHTQAGRPVHHLAMDARDPRFQLRTLRQAARLLRGERKLAEFLDIEGWLVSRWLGGLGQPPDFIFLRCIELIESSKQAATAAKSKQRGEKLGGQAPKP